MNTHSPEATEPVLQEHDWTIAERLDEIEHLLKFVPLPWYRRELIREYLELTTDPDEAKNG